MATENPCPSCGRPLPADSPQGMCPQCLMQAGFATGATPQPGAPTGQTRPAPPSIPELGKAFPQLELLQLLGQGGMGAVYKARQKHLHRLVALKILPSGTGGDPAFAERFTREAQALAQLNHPGIITLYEFGHTPEGLYYLILEFVDGVNLRQLQATGRLSPREALAIVPEICDALQYAHDQGVVHRDIKPENILVDRRGRVKIADFGLAKLVGTSSEPDQVAGLVTGETTLTEAGKVLGTPHYMAPEQIERPTEVDHRADIYALGVVFYQMLTGELPGKEIEPPSKKVRIDVRLDEIVLRALERKPERRYQQVSEVKTGVETILGAAAEQSRQGEKKPSEDPTTTPAHPAGNVDGIPSPKPRFSRAAIFGAVWAVWFFVNWLCSYTPPGWKITAAIRQSGIGPVANALVLGPLQLLGIAAPLGATALGVIALREMRRSRGALSGFSLGWFVAVLFPVLLLNRWLFWLGWRVAAQISLGDMATSVPARPSSWAMVVLALIALAVNGVIIGTAWRLGKRFLSTPVPPATQRSDGTWRQECRKACPRLLLVFLVQFVLLETLQQVEVHWKESQGEPWDMALTVASLAALVWAFWPRFRLKAAWAYFVGGTILSGALLFGWTILYLGPVRTNLGLYEEPDWVSELPGFQHGYRLGRAKFLWRRKLVAPNFGSTANVSVALENEHRAQCLSLSNGQNLGHDSANERLRDTVQWARGEQMDLILSMHEGQLTVQGLDLAVLPVAQFDRETRPQDVADHWLFEKYPPKEATVLWPTEDYWTLERKYSSKDIPRPFRAGGGAYLFRTRTGVMGVLRVTSSPEHQHNVQIRYKLVQADTVSSGDSIGGESAFRGQPLS